MDKLSTKHDALHALEYDLLPKLVDNGLITTLRELIEICEDEEPVCRFYDEIDFYNMQVVHSTSTSLGYYLIRFPEPVDDSLAYFGIVVIWFGESRYFTLEKGRDANYVCEVTQAGRSQLSVYEGTIDMDDFRKHIIASYYTLPPLTDKEVEAIFQKGWSHHAEERFAKAVEYYRQAAMYGHDQAQEYLGEFYMAGRGGLERDEMKAVMWFELSSWQGNKYAKWCLDDMHQWNFQELIGDDDDELDDLDSI